MNNDSSRDGDTSTFLVSESMESPKKTTPETTNNLSQVS